jgi:general secretion pathway protein G
MVGKLKSRRSFGFTLLEMMIVIIIMGILLSIAIPIYSQSIVRARESVLRNDLAELNKLVQQYTLDKQKAPQSLDDLVSAGYIHQVPKDPMTGEQVWDTPQCEVLDSIDQQDPGICEVHSTSTAMSTEGTAYNTWN